MAQSALMQVLHQLPSQRDKDLIVGTDTADDASVYRLSDEVAIICTLDFFPPIVDDAYTFGQISAANALSDIYAMGGKPRLAMNIVCFPEALPIEVLNEIIRGSTDKLREADTLLVGGHSIEDREIKYGLSVTGIVKPSDVVTNSGARPGNLLILTKPIGVGIITTALRRGRCSYEDAIPALESMTQLNRDAVDIMKDAGVSACTDITGFGLVGHAVEMATASGVSLVIDSHRVEVFPVARDLVRRRANRPKTLVKNMEYLEGDVRVVRKVERDLELLLYDPQTSGGLLMAIPEDRADWTVRELNQKGTRASIIGRVIEKESHSILIQ